MKWIIKRYADGNWYLYQGSIFYGVARTWREAMACVEWNMQWPVVYGDIPWHVTLAHRCYHES